MILPFSETEATWLLELENSGLFLEETDTFAGAVSPTVSVTESFAKQICGFLTVTSQVLLQPSTVTVIVAVPCLTAVTVPFWSTVATLFLLVFHLGVLLDVLETESFTTPLRKSETELLLSFRVGCLTVTWQAALVRSAVAVIVAVPGFLAVITPFSSTEATLFLRAPSMGAI